ncbi:glycosyltransferase family 25 protein [Sedimentimonas flavescens]|uniref:glycosyltransferase family 25 protein n=1 Tax=Sedimentimonas flavescens TaxID=2851012 RepID=UPI001C4A2484|nr:glycosyltransferase family 25 protein [Sedimentimonas flavescens]MBW0159719.1 glycosyltransferase family 25 protein [Sedimentimonas flavescens]
MDCLVINLAAANTRMAFMADQLDALGIPFQRLEAVTPDTIGELAQAYNWSSWERPLKETEKACFLSHVNAWKYAATQDCDTLILEDDALLSRHTPKVLKALEDIGGVEHVTLEVRRRKKIVSKTGRQIGSAHQLLRLYQDRSGAAAYVLSPSGAQKLLARASTQVALADAMICKAYELKSFQIEPACAVQLDRALAYGIGATPNTVSQIDAGKLIASNKHSFGFRARRIGAQLRMAVRALLHLGVAERREIRLNPEDFQRS